MVRLDSASLIGEFRKMPYCTNSAVGFVVVKGLTTDYSDTLKGGVKFDGR